MDIKAYIKTHRARISDILVAYLRQKREQHRLRFYMDAVARLESFVTQGKMLRGVMVIMAAEMYGASGGGASDVSAAMELNQSSLLIHDDIMDQDLTRRGAATIYAQYMNEAGDSVSNRLLYGQSMGICAGDIGFFMASELIGRASVDNAVRQRIINEISTELQLCGGAQMADVRLAMADEEPTKEEILEVYRYKTGRYTFGLPLKVGAIIGGASQEDIAILDRFGEELGIIFQLKDDEIKLYGTKSSMGADAGSDVRENKKTIIRHMLFAKCSATERATLNTLFGNQQLTEEGLQSVKTLIDNHGILDEIRSDIERKALNLKELASGLKGKQEYRDLLIQLVDYNVQRRA